MGKRNDWLGDLMLRYGEQEDRLIRDGETRWRGKVSDSMDAMVRDLGAGILPAVLILDSAGSAPAIPAPKKRIRAARAKAVSVSAAVRALALTIAAAVVLSVGACVVSPTVRGLTKQVFTSVLGAESVPARTPDSYIIPSPGEDFSLTNEAEGDNMLARWFTSDRMEALVEIAYRLPENTSADAGEVVTVGDMWGTYRETGGTGVLILRDGDVYIHVEFWGADREEIMRYAEALVQANTAQ